MSYCLAADVRNVLDPDGDEGTMTSAAGMSDDQLSVAIEEAQAEVDGRIGARYAAVLPLSPVPLIVKNATRDIAAYKATLTYLQGQPIGNTDPVWLRYQDAKALVIGIATGAVTIPNGAGGVTAEDTSGEPGGTVVNQYDGDLFTLDDVGLVPDFNGGYRTFPFRRPTWP